MALAMSSCHHKSNHGTHGKETRKDTEQQSVFFPCLLFRVFCVRISGGGKTMLKIRSNGVIGLFSSALLLLLCAGKSLGQSAPQTGVPAQQQGGTDAAELAKKLSNPIASMISVPFQSNFDFGIGPNEDGFRHTLNIQPVIPFKLGGNWNLVSRTILPIIHQSEVVPSTTQNGLGDITQSFFFVPPTEGIIMGFGPALLIPTATDDLLGTGKFGLGPTVLVLKQHKAWTYGILLNHIWSVAGDDFRAEVNNTFIQPFMAYNTKSAWTFGLNAESSYNWTGEQWSVPIHITVSKLLKFGKQPVSLGGALRCWATSPSGGPQGCGFRLIGTLLFPAK